MKKRITLWSEEALKFLKTSADNLKIHIKAAADFLLPRTCIVCGRRLNLQERHLCLQCLMEMPLTYFWGQPHNQMADRFNELIQKDIGERKEAYAFAAALFVYREEAPYKKIPYHIKYQGDIRAGRYFGNILGSKMVECPHFDDVDLIIPVPLHWLRRLKRGYNQAEAIADGLASAMGVPVRTDLLVRTKRTATQTRLGLEAKAANVKGAFAVAHDKMQAVLESGPPRHVLLIDDVFTTGSTLHSCLLALRTALPCSVRISVAALGCVVQV